MLFGKCLYVPVNVVFQLLYYAIDLHWIHHFSWNVFLHFHIYKKAFCATKICHCYKMRCHQNVYTIRYMSVGWDVNWCPLSSITTPLARKRRFYLISKADRETFKTDHIQLIVATVAWLKFCWYGVKHDQSII